MERLENWLYQKGARDRLLLRYGQVQQSNWKMDFNNFDDFVICHHEDVKFMNHELKYKICMLTVSVILLLIYWYSYIFEREKFLKMKREKLNY